VQRSCATRIPAAWCAIGQPIHGLRGKLRPVARSLAFIGSVVNKPREPIRTPDGRYIVVRGRLWRAANPSLDASVHEGLVKELMSARRAVGAALKSGNRDDLSTARARVQAAKVALGERGEPWWTDGSPDFNRRMAKNTPYAEWWQGRSAG
jgi:hypothetical protein